jgi:putative MATE family efflux protein
LNQKYLIRLPEEKYTYRRILTIASPIIIGHLAENIINITDTIFVGRLGEKPLGAVGLGGLYYYTYVLIVMGLAMGAQILIGRRNGEKNYHQIGLITGNAIYTFAAIGIFLFTLLQVITPSLLSVLVKSRDIYELALSYVTIRSFGMLFVCMTFVFRAFYIGITHTKVIIFITIGAALINIFFNQVLIFGHLGFKPMGIRGSATASVIAEGCGLTGYYIYSILGQKNKKFNLFQFRKPDFGIIGSFLKLGVPIMLQSWISVSSWFVFFIFIEKLGERALSVSSIIKSLYVVMMIPVWGFGSATNTLVSNAMGAERQFEVLKITKKVMSLSVILMLAIVQVNIFFPGMVLSLFNRDPAIVADATGPLRMISFALLIFSAGGMMFNAVSGTGSTRISLYIELITLILYFSWIIVCGTFLKSGVVTWLWASEVVYMLSLAVFAFLYLRTGRWKGVKI